MPNVPDNNSFSLQDVYDAVHGHAPGTNTNLSSCFSNAVFSYFDPNYNNDTYNGSSLQGMKRFRNYRITSGVPTLTTSSISNTQITYVTSGGESIADNGSAITSRGLCVGLSANPTILGVHTSNGTGTSNFTGNVTNLLSGNTYYIRAYATNANGTGYGQDVIVTTLSTDFFEVTSTGNFYAYNSTNSILNTIFTGTFNGARAMISSGNYVYIVGNNGSAWIYEKLTGTSYAMNGLSSSYDYITIAYSSGLNKIVTSGQSGAYALLTPGDYSWTGTGTITSGADVYSLVATGSTIYALASSNRIFKSTNGTSYSLWVSLIDSNMGENDDARAMCINPNITGGFAGSVSVYGANFYQTNSTIGVAHLNTLGGVDYTSLYLANIGDLGGLYADKAYYSPNTGHQYVIMYEAQFSGLYVSDIGSYNINQAYIYGIAEHNGIMLFGQHRSSDGAASLDFSYGEVTNGIDIVGND